ncbi:hypothetical protein [Rubrobacter indicoceani]|uniref:hypothetical protein n=1 Tax=Rubrobacter indicoceani TaxID=2051957 RepID=UPI000E5AFBDE|nr:hypothetical protein [Rubrobacter indicoceani]
MSPGTRSYIREFPRGAIGWVLATLFTFVVVSLAFLVLASFANNPPEVSLIPNPSENRPGASLSLDLNEEELSLLQPTAGQPLTVTLTNGGSERLPSVSIITEVSSENTARTLPVLYEEQIEDLAAGESRQVGFEIDLSENPESSPDYPDGTRRIVAVRAIAPGGLSDFETAIFPVGVNTDEG